MKVYAHEIQPNVNIKCKHKRAPDHWHYTHSLKKKFEKKDREKKTLFRERGSNHMHHQRSSDLTSTTSTPTLSRFLKNLIG